MGEPIDFSAREPHFLDHLAPVWRALSASSRGQFFVARGIEQRARSEGIVPVVGAPSPSGRLTYVASFGDLKYARKVGRRVVLTEHGAGQSYLGSLSGSYIGAPDRNGCVAVFVPGPEQAVKARRAHPKIPTYVIGCPKLDTWPTGRVSVAEPVVAISFHWDSGTVPETKSAFLHYQWALKALARAFPGRVLGHAHPRWDRDRRHVHPFRWYDKFGIECVTEFSEVVRRADVYGVDNSSTLFEFAALDRPVVVLDAPWYRRNVEHGLRFWRYADVGVRVGDAEQLVAAYRAAIEDPAHVRDRRRVIVDQVYAGLGTGGAAARAAAVLRSLV